MYFQFSSYIINPNRNILQAIPKQHAVTSTIDGIDLKSVYQHEKNLMSGLLHYFVSALLNTKTTINH